MTEKETVEFMLTELLEYSVTKGNNKGTKSNTACIIMRPPRMTEFNESSDFGQMVAGALADVGKFYGDVKNPTNKDEPKKKSDEDMTAAAVRIMLFSSDRSVSQIAKRFRALACKVCTLDDSGSYIKDSHMDKMSLKDFTNMMCEYVANFTYPSLFKDMEDSEGEQSQEKSGEPLEATL